MSKKGMSKEGTTTLPTERFLELLKTEKVVSDGGYLEVSAYGYKGNYKVYGDVKEIDAKLQIENDRLGDRVYDLQRQEEKYESEIRNLKINVDNLEYEKGVYKFAMIIPWVMVALLLILIF